MKWGNVTKGRDKWLEKEQLASEDEMESEGAAQLRVSSAQLMGVNNVPITSCTKLSKPFNNTKERRKRVSSAHEDKWTTLEGYYYYIEV